MFQKAHIIAGQIEPSVSERKFSRRRLLGGAMGGFAVASAVSLPNLSVGVSFNKPPLTIEPVRVGRRNDDIQLFSKTISEEDGSVSILTLTPEGKLLFEPSEEFFIEGEWIGYVHRGGNSPESIDESYKKYIEQGKGGPLVLDLDANFKRGVVYGEHGIVYQAQLRLLGRQILRSPPLVIDVNEAEVSVGKLNTYEANVAHIAHIRNTTGDPIAVSAELKRGNFGLDAMYEMYAIHRRHKVPGLLHSPNPNQFDAIRKELA